MDSTNKHTENLTKLRKLMSESNYDAYIIPHSDAHDVIYPL